MMLSGPHSKQRIIRRLLSRESFLRLRHVGYRELSTLASTGNNDKIPIWYPIAGGFLITLAGGAHYLHDHFDGTEGIKRSVSFYGIAVPMYFQYRYHMWKKSPDEVWDDLDTKTSNAALAKILELKGFYIKCGQMCANNIGNAFPKIWQETMAVLQDKVPHKDFATVKQIVESDMGKPLSEVFATFEEEPIGAASIGQVHRATLKDGQEVVVKVMYPEVEGLLRGDVRTIKLFAEIAQPVHVPALEEVEKQFMTEFDYVKEGYQLEKVRENLTRAGLAGDATKLCAVPRPYRDLTTKKVLVMEELKGDKLVVALEKNFENYLKFVGKTKDEMLQAQQEQGPSSSEYALYLSVLETRRRLENAVAGCYNVLVGWVPGVPRWGYRPKDVVLLNHAKLVDDLMYIHGHEVLVDGFFNADCHPGNILLLRAEESQPQLGLIDYGQVKKLSTETRILFCELVIALANDDRGEIIRLMKEAGYKSRKMDEDNIYLYARVSFDEDNAELTGGLHIQMFMEELQSRDPIEELPKELLMVSRTSIMLRGLAHALHQSRSVAKLWKPIAEQALKDHQAE